MEIIRRAEGKRMQEITALFHRFPELSLFVTIFFGTLIGRIHIKGFGLGSVVGSLIAGIVIGIFAKPEFPQLLRWIFFYLFLFSVGYSVGPRFFGSLRKEAIPQIVLAITMAVTGLATAVTVASVLKFDEGISVGLLSGALTQSAALGTGLNAIAALPVSDEIKSRLSGNAPLADAITYGFGDLGLILFISCLRTDDDARESEGRREDIGGPAIKRRSNRQSASCRQPLRLSRLPCRKLFHSGHQHRFELEERYASGRLSVQRIKRGDKLISLSPDTRIQLGDLLVIAAQRAVLANAEREIGPEFDDLETLAVPMKSVTVVVTKRSVIGKTLAELAADRQAARGVYLESLKRGEEEMPRDMGVKLERGDVVRIVGSPQDVERVGKSVGYVEADMTKTDLTFVAAGIACGVLLGLLTFNVNGVPLGLGTAGSILVVGLVAGLGAEPLSGIRFNPGGGTARACGHWPDRFHCDRGPGCRAACSPGIYGAWRRLLRQHLFWRHGRDDGPAAGRHGRGPMDFQDEPVDGPCRRNRCADLHASTECVARSQRKQYRRSRLHRSVRDRKYPADDLGTRHGGNHAFPAFMTGELVRWKFAEHQCPLGQFALDHLGVSRVATTRHDPAYSRRTPRRLRNGNLN